MTRTIVRAMARPHGLLVDVLAVDSSAARAADIKVIANPSVGATSVSSEELKGVFLDTESSLSDGSHVEPVLLKSGAVHEAFRSCTVSDFPQIFSR